MLPLPRWEIASEAAKACSAAALAAQLNCTPQTPLLLILGLCMVSLIAMTFAAGEAVVSRSLCCRRRSLHCCIHLPPPPPTSSPVLHNRLAQAHAAAHSSRGQALEFLEQLHLTCPDHAAADNGASDATAAGAMAAEAAANEELQELRSEVRRLQEILAKAESDGDSRVSG